MTKNIDMELFENDVVHAFNSGYTCSESIVYTIRKHFELDLSDDAIAMSSGFPWGLGGGGCICGALAGSTMCLGYFFGRREPDDQKIHRCFELTKELHDAFQNTCGSTCCKFLTQGLEPGSSIRKAKCTEYVTFAAKKTAQIIISELS